MELQLGHFQVNWSPQFGRLFQFIGILHLGQSCCVDRKPLDLRKSIWSLGFVLKSTGPSLCNAIPVIVNDLVVYACVNS